MRDDARRTTAAGISPYFWGREFYFYRNSIGVGFNLLSLSFELSHYRASVARKWFNLRIKEDVEMKKYHLVNPRLIALIVRWGMGDEKGYCIFNPLKERLIPVSNRHQMAKMLAKANFRCVWKSRAWSDDMKKEYAPFMDALQKEVDILDGVPAINIHIKFGPDFIEELCGYFKMYCSGSNAWMESDSYWALDEIRVRALKMLYRLSNTYGSRSITPDVSGGILLDLLTTWGE